MSTNAFSVDTAALTSTAGSVAEIARTIDGIDAGDDLGAVASAMSESKTDAKATDAAAAVADAITVLAGRVEETADAMSASSDSYRDTSDSGAKRLAAGNWQVS